MTKLLGFLRSPALHMLVLGGLALAAVALSGGLGSGERQRIVVPQYRLDLMIEAFVTDNARSPTVDERRGMVDALVDEEVLYQYALALGMFEHPAVEARLAKIAEFVEANPHEATSEPERAAAAMELGLHHGDLVVRRIMVDSARRLIRSVVLLQEPAPERLAAYLAAHREEFLRPGTTRISHVTVNGFRWDDPEARARAVRAQIEVEGLDIPAALALADPGLVPAELPALTDGALATKLGHTFAERVAEIEPGRWSEPVESRYGYHLVFVHERTGDDLPLLEEIHAEVSSRLRQELADEWLERRLRELREEFEIEAPSLDGAGAPGRLS